MRLLVVTEKCSSSGRERDGGARLIETLLHAFPEEASILQFGPQPDERVSWHFPYPHSCPNRFIQRLENAPFVGEVVQKIAPCFTHLLFVHISLQFGLKFIPLPSNLFILTFPMFLTPSYIASGEEVPPEYLQFEREVLPLSHEILTPSHLEKRQLCEVYGIREEKIRVIPRGISTRFFSPQVRVASEPPLFCSLGSIKPQKNILGLIRLFSKLAACYSGSFLRIIGPVQNQAYYEDVLAEVVRLNLSSQIEFLGFLPPDQVACALGNAHIHLSCSLCETFGRAIFETLALGIPNVAQKRDNAAAEYLHGLPYARFVEKEDEALREVDTLLTHLDILSAMATEIGTLYDESVLSVLLAAVISQEQVLTISDFDGTLYHKRDAAKTDVYMEKFRRLPAKVLCSARGLEDLLEQAEKFSLQPDWIVAYSGGVLARGDGTLVHTFPLQSEQIATLKRRLPKVEFVSFQGEILQGVCSETYLPNFVGLRRETYQGQTFFSPWQASKLHAVHSLLRTLNWKGQVEVFGDGRYDAPLIQYFDGTWID